MAIATPPKTMGFVPMPTGVIHQREKSNTISLEYSLQAAGATEFGWINKSEALRTFAASTG